MKLSSRDLFSVSVLAVILLSGCQKAREPQLGENYVTPSDPAVVRHISSDDKEFLVLGNQAIMDQAKVKNLILADTKESTEFLSSIADWFRPKAKKPVAETDPVDNAVKTDNSLVVGYPLGLLKEYQVFGGVVTKVSDKKSEALGRLKLSDMTPIQVRPAVLPMGNGKFALGLMGCPVKCSETSAELPIIGFPILGVDSKKTMLVVDLSAVGQSLNLVKMMDPTGAATKLKTKSSRTTVFDYSYSTLVFDVETRMIPVQANPNDTNAPETVFTVRWYLRLASAFNPAFEPRGPTAGVGFFMTRRTTSPRIQRFSKPLTGGTANDPGPVKYYVKNVPEEYQKAFASAFDGWNQKFVDLTGKKLLSYEFIAPNDPRSQFLVTGDTRFNILEWDLNNKAPYGGLGPSIANQFTGEMLSANVLIQGPNVVTLYKKWFTAAQQAESLLSESRVMEADQVKRNALNELEAEEAAQDSTRFQLGLGDIDFQINSQLPELEDPLFDRDDFDSIPTGQNYDTYMFGYFHDMVTHELGHNLGLRHNFRGNLSAADKSEFGKVSHSIMEYLNKNFRYLDDIGPYDVMAIKYGYTGVQPTRRDMYCTDEDVYSKANPKGSAECSRDDATNDPYGYFEQRFQKIVDLIDAKGSPTAPVWTAKDVSRDLGIVAKGLGLYAFSAKATAATWTNFSKGGERPTDPDEIKTYVLSRLKGQLCGAEVTAAIDEKATPEAKAKTAANLEDLRAKVADILKKLVNPADISCS